jgi:hypothetical protein
MDVNGLAKICEVVDGALIYTLRLNGATQFVEWQINCVLLKWYLCVLAGSTKSFWQEKKSQALGLVCCSCLPSQLL